MSRYVQTFDCTVSLNPIMNCLFHKSLRRNRYTRSLNYTKLRSLIFHQRLTKNLLWAKGFSCRQCCSSWPSDSHIIPHRQIPHWHTHLNNLQFHSFQSVLCSMCSWAEQNKNYIINIIKDESHNNSSHPQPNISQPRDPFSLNLPMEIS